MNEITVQWKGLGFEREMHDCIFLVRNLNKVQCVFQFLKHIIIVNHMGNTF